MPASNFVSTTFRCLSCSFGTYSQVQYVEHIKDCNNESTSKLHLPVTSNEKQGRSNLSKTLKKHQASYVCRECRLPTSSSRSLLLHRRDVHGEDLRIFVCKFCSHYASLYRGSVYKHAMNKHPSPRMKGGVYTELHKKCVIKEVSADNEASADEHCIPQVEATSCEQNKSSISATELDPVKSSRSLGLQFLGKQHPDIGRDEYVCRLCSFAHKVSEFVVKHIWTDHRDRLSEGVAEACTVQAIGDARITNTLYTCDDCTYSTHVKCNFYNHCAYHQFEGPSKCPHCSYSAWTDGAIVKHAQIYHNDRHSGDLNANVTTRQCRSVCTKICAPCKIAKRSDSSHYKKQYAQRHRKKTWFTCPYCTFKSRWSTSVCRHKAHVHAELHKSCRKRSSADDMSYTRKLKKMNAGDAVEIISSGNTAEQQKPTTGSLPGATSTQPKQTMHTRDICSAECKPQNWQTQREVRLDLRRYQCPLCGLRSNYFHNVRTHICNMHKDDKTLVVKLSLEDAKHTIKAYRKHSVKQVHLDLRRYQCPLCGLRSNYFQNTHKHICNVHKDEKTGVVKLSLEDARHTIKAYRKHAVKLSHRQEKCFHSSMSERCSKALHPASSGKSKAVPQYSISTPNNHMLAVSSECSVVQVKRQTMDNSDASPSSVGTDFPSLRKCCACSVCKKPLSNNASAHRHLHNVHDGMKAKMNVVKEKMFVHKSKLCHRRKTAKVQKLNAEKSGNCSILYNQELEKRCPRSVDNKEHDISRESGVHLCEHCPFMTVRRAALVCQKQLHHPQASAIYKCEHCAFWVTKPGKLVRHTRVHTAEYLQKRMEHSQLPKMSDAPEGDVVAMVSEKQTVVTATSLCTKQAVDDDKKHQKSDLKGGVHLCEHCPYMTVRRAALIYHRQLHRPRAFAPYKCKHCAFWVTEQRHLANHTRVHTTEYLHKRMKHSHLPQISNALDGSAMQMVSEKQTMAISPVSASSNSKDFDGVPVKNIVTTDTVDEMSQNKSDNDEARTASVANNESLVAISEENADDAVQSNSAAASHQLLPWCCDRCPYVTSKLVCIKRHRWLHGKQYPYVCPYCDYSVLNYWHLVSHLLWHSVPNRHLVYAQPVSILDSFWSQLQNHYSIANSVASIDRVVPSFENTGAFPFADAAGFQCSDCPFVTKQRSEFLTHTLCHCLPSAAYSCPYCNFHTDLPQRLSAHISVHFNLPGCRQSFLPTNVCHSEDWKQLDAAIEAVAKKSTCSRPTESQCAIVHNCNDWSYGQIESTSPLQADTPVSQKNQAARPSDCDSDLSMARSLGTLKVICSEDDDVCTLTAVPQPAVYHFASADSQRASVIHSTANSSLVEPLSADDVTSVPINRTKFCRYCDKVIDDPSILVKHEAAHLICVVQPVP